MPSVRWETAAEMLAFLLGVMTFCPLVFGGLAPSQVAATANGEMHAAEYSAYISNPSPFALSTSRLQLWAKDSQDSKTAHEVPEDIPKTQIPGHTDAANAVVVKFTDTDLILNNYVGVTVECDGIR